MGNAATRSVALIGLDGAIVEVEASVTSGLAAFVLVGLADTALGEARHRVRAAATSSGCPLSAHSTTINLGPASLPKHGSAFDLAIALAALAADAKISAESVGRVLHIGELGLDGRLRPTPGILPAVLAARRAGAATVMVPRGSLTEAELVPGVRVIGIASLREAAIWHGAELEPVPVEAIAAPSPQDPRAASPDLADVVGGGDAVNALVAAAAGGHHMLLLGPPGAGKTMLATRLPGLLPDLDDDAALEVGSLRSLAGLPVGGALSRRPPFEAPHHTASTAAIVGGGSRQLRPGAAARSSHGVLFLDEAPEFAPSTLDALRQPLECGEITIQRAAAVARFPARFQLVLAANPCPCGQAGSRDAECVCTPNARRRYLQRMSGPLLDRVDIRLRVPRVTAAQLRTGNSGRPLGTAEARDIVEAARGRALSRLAGTGWRCNSAVPGSWLRSSAGVPARGASVALDRALERGLLTMRGHDRVLRLAWTLADLDDVDRPTAEHIGRALYLRRAAA